MSKSKTHKDLDIWKRGIELVERIYKITGTFPKEELYGLTAQLRRAAVSYPSNIAEGAARPSKKEYIQYLYISLASLSEIETQLIISKRLNYLKKDDLFEEIDALRKMTLSLIRYLKQQKQKCFDRFWWILFYSFTGLLFYWLTKSEQRSSEIHANGLEACPARHWLD